MRGLLPFAALLLCFFAACGGDPSVPPGGAGGLAGAGAGGGAGGTGGLAEGGSGGSGGSAGVVGTGGGGGSAARCGDGVREGDEACDGEDLAGNTCPSLGFDGGELGCVDCEFDTSDCFRVERCDNGTDDDGDGLTDCADPDCAEQAPCPRCGDGEVNVEGEACDGSMVSATCADFGHALGDVRCNDSCELDTSDCRDPEDCQAAGDEDHDGLENCADPDCSTEFECPVCGNGVLQQSEGCDGVAGSSCIEHGFDGGTFNCASGCIADTSGCRDFVCGDGFIDGTERCDDSNTVNGDGCNSACQIEGDDCTAPIALVWDAASGTWIWEGDTTGFYADHMPSCADTQGVPDAVASFTAPAAGRYYVSVDAAFDTVLFAWDGTCGSGSSLGCMNESGEGETEGFELDLQANQTVYFGVSGLANIPEGSSNRGPFRLTLIEVTCNDGVLEGLEQCEDGNTIAGDGCSPTCRWEGDTCADAVDMSFFPADPGFPGYYRWAASTAQFTPNFASSCFPSANRDGVARFVAPADGLYGVLLYAAYPASLHIWSGLCGPQPAGELECSNGMAPPTGTARVQAAIDLNLTAHQEVYLVVDGYSFTDDQYGDFWLSVMPGTECGDGITGWMEACDDGNQAAGDGCSAACTWEGTVESEPNDTFATADSLSLGVMAKGAVLSPPLVDRDLWAFNAAAGATYVLRTSSRLDGTCPASASGDTRLRLFDGTGAVLAENDDVDVSNDCSQIEWTAPASGTYYAEVIVQRQRLWGSYPEYHGGWGYNLSLTSP